MTCARAFLVLCQLAPAVARTYIYDTLHSTSSCSDSSQTAMGAESGKCVQVSSNYAAARELRVKSGEVGVLPFVGMRLLDADHPRFPNDIIYCVGDNRRACELSLDGSTVVMPSGAVGTTSDSWCRRYIASPVGENFQTCTNQTADESLATACTLPRCHWNVTVFTEPESATPGFIDDRPSISTEVLLAFAWGGFLFIFLMILAVYCSSRYEAPLDRRPPRPVQPCVFSLALAIEQPCQEDPLSLALPSEPPPPATLPFCSHCGATRKPNARFCVRCKKELTFHV